MDIIRTETTLSSNPLPQRTPTQVFVFKHSYINKNKEERYSRVPRLSDTRYSKGNGDMQATKRD